MIVYSSENPSDQPSEEFSSDEASDMASDPYSIVVRGLYSSIVRGQGPLYSIESQ